MKPVEGQIYYDKVGKTTYVVTKVNVKTADILYNDGSAECGVYFDDILCDKLVGTCSIRNVLDSIFK